MPTDNTENLTAQPASPARQTWRPDQLDIATASGPPTGTSAQPTAAPQAPNIQGPAPSSNALAALGPAQAPQPAPPSPQQQAQAANVGKHALLGRLATYLLGHEQQYIVDPQSGQVVTQQTQRRPGDIFRSIVTGAVVGMAAGAGSHDFAGGFGQGGAAAIQNQRVLDQQRYVRAQQQAENQQKQQTFDEDKKFREAQIAQMNANNIRADWEMGLQTQKGIDEHNDRDRAFQLQLDQMGATPLPIQSGGADINGQMGNGAALQRLVGQDLDTVKAPDGYHTLHTMTVDTSGLTFKGGQWLDADGNPVSIESRTAHTLYQMPDNIWNKHADGIATGADLNKVVGFKLVDPDAKINMTVGDVMSARAKGQEVALESAKLNVDVMKARLEAANARRQLEIAGKQIDADNYKQFLATYDTTRATVASLEDQIKARQTANPDADVSDLQKELNDTTDDLAAIRQHLFPNTVRPGTATPQNSPTKAPPKPPKAGAVITADIAKLYLTANGNDPAKARQAAQKDGWGVSPTR